MNRETYGREILEIIAQLGYQADDYLRPEQVLRPQFLKNLARRSPDFDEGWKWLEEEKFVEHRLSPKDDFYLTLAGFAARPQP
jgi:hypothetical protein